MNNIKQITVALIVFACINSQLFGYDFFEDTNESFIFEKKTKNWPAQIFADYTVEIWGNISGGVKKAVRYDGLLSFGISAKTENFSSWQGGELYIQGNWYQGNLKSNELSGVDGPFNTSGIEAGNGIRFYNIYYGQNLLNEKLYIKFGQIAADDDFMITDYADLFINAAFGNMPLSASINPYPAYPLAAPGIYTEIKPTDTLKIMLGLYTSNAGNDESNNHGFKWEIGGDTGYTLFSQLQMQDKLLKLPFTLTAGSYLAIDSQLNNQSNQTLVNNQTIYALYLMWSQAWLVNPDKSTKLGSFFRIEYIPDHQNFSVNNIYIDAGINWFSPIPGRNADIAGLAFNFADYTSAFQKANPLSERNQWIIELTYLAQLNGYVQLQPDIQYTINPQNAKSNALVVGSRLNITF